MIMPYIKFKGKRRVFSTLVRSMTGYGRCEQIFGKRKILAEIKSVNHRYCEILVKAPKNYGFLEQKIRNEAAAYIFRGKAEILISIEDFEGYNKSVSINKVLAKEYLNALYELRDEFALKDDICVSLLAGFGDIFKTETTEEDPEELYAQIRPVFTKAAEEFVASRKREGEKMYADIESRIKYMRVLLGKIDEQAPKITEDYKNRLECKINELLKDYETDEARVLAEVAIFADKTAVDEETVRLASHFDEFLRIINADEPAGRRLDFLVQEINREINTIGSKSCDINISRLVIDLKAEAEKIREQIQNIE